MSRISSGNKTWDMTIEFLKCRADLNFEVYFGVNGAIGAIVTKWDIIIFGLLYSDYSDSDYSDSDYSDSDYSDSDSDYIHNIDLIFNTLRVPLKPISETMLYLCIK